MTPVFTFAFDHPLLCRHLAKASEADLDALDYGLIGFDAESMVRNYNRYESEATGLSPESVVGQPLFSVVAACMNNYLVAQRFEDAADNGSALDATIDYVFTLRMRPVKVKLRLLSHPAETLRYVLVLRRT